VKNSGVFWDGIVGRKVPK